MFGGQAIVCGLLAAEWGASNRPILALKSDAQPSLDSAQRESVLGHYHTESFTRLAHPGCPSNSRRDQGAMLFTKRWTTGDAMRARTSTWGLLRRLGSIWSSL